MDYLNSFSNQVGLSSKLLKEFFHLINTAVLILDQGGQILFANRYANQLFEKENLEGFSLKDFFSVEDQNVLYPNIFYLTKKEGFYEGPVLLSSSGKSFLAQISVNRFATEEKEFFVVTCQNISALKKLEKSMREAKHLAFLGQMLSDMSHQVRNPILVIGGLAKRLQEKPSKISSYASAIIYQCVRLEKLLKALEEFVNLPRPRYEPVKVREILKHLSHQFRLEMLGEEPELRFHLNPGIEEVTFFTDLYLLVRALAQVIRNALEAHQDRDVSEPVEVKIWATENKINFEIVDWGEGIPQKILSFITNPFFSTKSGHMGMGLTLTQRIVEELEGQMEVINLKSPTAIRLHFPIDRRRPERKTLLS